jgi:hypothetical protein
LQNAVRRHGFFNRRTLRQFANQGAFITFLVFLIFFETNEDERQGNNGRGACAKKSMPKITKNKAWKTHNFIIGDFLGMLSGKYKNDKIYGRLGRKNT